MRAAGGVCYAALSVVLLAACARLPDADSPGAKLYAARCSNDCHRVYAPTLLKYEMWKYQVVRMQDVLARAGVAPLTDEEMAIILDYLRRHSG
ncbi:MAG: hypothetical protein HY699_01945 [Deltaproteobacteria bacterium]|nr:hypothetical protein [Deltaproteobacteria bacterium]